MIRNLSFNDPHIRQELEAKIGKPIPFFERLKMGGIGSQRLVIEDASPVILEHLEQNNHIRYSNIELRKGGIIVGFHSRLNIYGLVIDFNELLVRLEENRLWLGGQEYFILLKPFNRELLDPKFIHKLRHLQETKRGIV